jgi:hypothetical protein
MCPPVTSSYAFLFLVEGIFTLLIEIGAEFEEEVRTLRNLDLIKGNGNGSPA